MKYLKLFENLDGELYKQIYKDEYTDITDTYLAKSDKRENFTQNEVDKISVFFKKYTVKYDNSGVLRIISPGAIQEIYIDKLKDEWYCVWDTAACTYFKCDTFEGLIELISTLLINSIKYVK